MAIKADIEALKDSVRARINDNEEQDITAADVRESVIDTIDTLTEDAKREYQQKEPGKGLSENNYTSKDKAKVDGSIQQIIHNGVALPVSDGKARINTVTTSEVDSKISYAIGNEARERQAMDTRFRQEIGDINALETEVKQIVPAINEALHKTGGDSYTKSEIDAIIQNHPILVINTRYNPTEKIVEVVSHSMSAELYAEIVKCGGVWVHFKGYLNTTPNWMKPLVEADGAMVMTHVFPYARLAVTNSRAFLYGAFQPDGTDSKFPLEIEYFEYAEKSDLSSKQDKLTAGDNITIKDNVISSTGGSGDVSFEEVETEGDIPEIHVFADAPSDGKQYARENGAWKEVQGGASGDWEYLGLLPIDTSIQGQATYVLASIKEYSEVFVDIFRPTPNTELTTYFSIGYGATNGADSVSLYYTRNNSSLANRHKTFLMKDVGGAIAFWGHGDSLGSEAASCLMGSYGGEYKPNDVYTLVTNVNQTAFDGTEVIRIWGKKR